MLSTLLCILKTKWTYLHNLNVIIRINKVTVTSLNTSPYANFHIRSQMFCFLQPGSTEDRTLYLLVSKSLTYNLLGCGRICSLVISRLLISHYSPILHTQFTRGRSLHGEWSLEQSGLSRTFWEWRASASLCACAASSSLLVPLPLPR